MKKKYSAFSPYAYQTVLDAPKEIFAIERYNKNTENKVQVFVNTSNKIVEASNWKLILKPFEVVIKEV